MKKNFNNHSGFTLIELLVVVVILGVLAAIAIPQFSSTTDSAKESALDSTLTNMRSAIALYNQQHGELPAVKTAVPGTACGGTSDGTGAVGSEAAFISQLTMFTTANGAACSKKTTAYRFGPYLEKQSIPANPITDVATVIMSTSPELGLVSSTASAGWFYSSATGKFMANDTDTDAAGNAYYTH